MSRDTKALLVLQEHWSCALLRAELLERGLQAACCSGFGAAMVLAADPMLEPIHVVLVEDEALSERDREALASSRSLAAPPALVLLTRGAGQGTRGPFYRVLRRPITIGSLADALEGALRLADFRQPFGDSTSVQQANSPAFSVRRGPPWPMVRCRRCGASRHAPMPLLAGEDDRIGACQLKFVLEHVCHASELGQL